MDKLLLGLIRAYQLTLGPFVGQQCRFTPSCSRYAQEAIRTHGAARGTWLAVKRIGRCQPFCEGGIDPVPLARKGVKATPGAGTPGGSGQPPQEAPNPSDKPHDKSL